MAYESYGELNGEISTLILCQTLQAVHKPRQVLTEMLRIGRNASVSFPNFGRWRVRLKLLTGGHMPVTETLDQRWYDTASPHFSPGHGLRGVVAPTG